MRVYFVDLITVYKTIFQFPVVSTVNSRTPVIFQMWLPLHKVSKTSQKNWSDPALGEPLNSSTPLGWDALQNSFGCCLGTLA